MGFKAIAFLKDGNEGGDSVMTYLVSTDLNRLNFKARIDAVIGVFQAWAGKPRAKPSF